MVLTSLVTLLLSSVLLSLVFYSNTTKGVKDRLREEGIYIAKALESADDAYLPSIGLTSKNRLTLIDYDGTVLYDNFVDPLQMENHADRPEVKEAKTYGKGEDTRRSETIGEQTFYFAIELENDQIFRIASTTKTAFAIFLQTFLWIIPIILTIFIIGVFLSQQITKLIIEPILKLNLDNPLINNSYPELSPLLLRMARQNKRIDDQMKEAKAKEEEFNAVTENLEEGLIIFDDRRNLLFANKSAKVIFHQSLWEGRNYLQLSRDIDYIKVLDQTFLGSSATAKVVWDGKIYRLISHSVSENEEKRAAVLFLVDITDRELAEQRRREFSANVSHELKTPLTSIMGYAEIIHNGIAKKEDIPRFSQEIYQGAAQLLVLIDDIIKLSRLDEGDLQKQFAPVDLMAIATKVIQDLTKKADSLKVSLELKGSSPSIQAVEKMLYELVFNLVDNAIVYNRENGFVKVSILETETQVSLSVEDNGIGIAPKHQDRIFERFYRIDQSHSKETGGTGLGLSIVKHTAQLHNALINVTSKLNKGTTITVTFPKA